MLLLSPDHASIVYLPRSTRRLERHPLTVAAPGDRRPRSRRASTVSESSGRSTSRAGSASRPTPCTECSSSAALHSPEPFILVGACRCGQADSGHDRNEQYAEDLFRSHLLLPPLRLCLVGHGTPAPCYFETLRLATSKPCSFEPVLRRTHLLPGDRQRPHGGDGPLPFAGPRLLAVRQSHTSPGSCRTPDSSARHHCAPTGVP